VSSGHVHFVAKLRNDLKMKLIRTPTPLNLPVVTFRLLFLGLIRCTHCPTLNCTYTPFTKQSSAYQNITTTFQHSGYAGITTLFSLPANENGIMDSNVHTPNNAYGIYPIVKGFRVKDCTNLACRQICVV
jgi:hypothetical protein